MGGTKRAKGREVFKTEEKKRGTFKGCIQVTIFHTLVVKVNPLGSGGPPQFSGPYSRCDLAALLQGPFLSSKKISKRDCALHMAGIVQRVVEVECVPIAAAQVISDG